MLPSIHGENGPTVTAKRSSDSSSKLSVKYTQQGFGIAFTREGIKKYVLDSNSALRTLAPDQFGDEHFTFAATAFWRRTCAMAGETNSFPPIKFVFDLCTERQKLEIAKAFIKANQAKPQFVDGIEQWLDVDADGISFASRKDTVQLLSADMLAWVTAKIRAFQEYPETAKRKGWPKDLSRVAFRLSTARSCISGTTRSNQFTSGRAGTSILGKSNRKARVILLWFARSSHVRRC